MFINKHTSVWIIMFIMGFNAAVSSYGAELFSENWNTGSINPTIWTVTKQNVNNIVLVNLGGGDYALAFKGYQDGGVYGSWGDWVYSTGTYPRGATGVYVQFKAWYKSGVNAQTGMHAGWHWSKAGPIYSSNEAFVDYLYSDFRATEYLDGLQAGPSMACLNNVWPSAASKAGAPLIRITLSPTIGAKWQISTNGGSTWTTCRDTSNTGNSNHSNNYLGFGPFTNQAGTTYIDDIVVSTADINEPPGPDPFPTDIRDLGEHFNEPGADFTPWMFIPQSNVAVVDTSTHRGLAMIYEADNGQDIKGILDKAIPINQYQLPWEMQLCIQQGFNITAGRSSGQLNTAIGLNIALTFSNSSSWPTDRTQQPPNTYSFQLFAVHLGNYGETGSGLPQLVSNPNLYRMDQDTSPEAYFIYGRGNLPASGNSTLGLWDIPYVWIGDGAKYGGPASDQIYFKCEILNSTQIRVGIKFDASHGWNTKVIDVGRYGTIKGIWEIGPIISADNWIPNTLAPALSINPPPAIDPPDPDYEYYVDYVVFRRAVPIPFEHYSDEFNILGYMGQWQIQEQSTIVETFSNPDYLTMTLLGSGCGTGIGPVGAPEFSLTTYPPPWEKEVCFIPPDNNDPWMFYLAMVAYGPNPSNYVIFLPGVKYIPGSGYSFMTGVGGNSPFQPQWPSPIPESLLASKPLYMIFQMLNTSKLRIGFKGDANDPWFFSNVYDTSATMPGGVISKWGLGCWSTTTGIINGGYGGPAYQQFLIDYVRYRYGNSGLIAVSGDVAVTEGSSTTDTYQVSCAGTPSSNVTVTVDPDSQLEVNSAGAGNPAQVTFTPSDQTPKTIIVKAVNDSVPEGTHTGIIKHTSSSGDSKYNNLTISDMKVTITDDDHGCGEPGQVYNVFDVTGPSGVRDCHVNFYDFAEFAAVWLDCSDLSLPGCGW